MPPLRLAAAALLFAALIAGSSGAAEIVERLSVPGPISFNGESYRLSWSSHPTANYYKQEYLPGGETGEHYRSMVLLEAIRRRFAPYGGVELDLPPREVGREPPDFGT